MPLLREIGDVKVKKAIDDGKLAKPKVAIPTPAIFTAWKKVSQ